MIPTAWSINISQSKTFQYQSKYTDLHRPFIYCVFHIQSFFFFFLKRMATSLLPFTDSCDPTIFSTLDNQCVSFNRKIFPSCLQRKSKIPYFSKITQTICIQCKKHKHIYVKKLFAVSHRTTKSFASDP